MSERPAMAYGRGVEALSPCRRAMPEVRVGCRIASGCGRACHDVAPADCPSEHHRAERLRLRLHATARFQ